nr:MAG TPA: hypothetical protein [Caudoviricetes sp.]
MLHLVHLSYTIGVTVRLALQAVLRSMLHLLHLFRV